MHSVKKLGKSKLSVSST